MPVLRAELLFAIPQTSGVLKRPFENAGVGGLYRLCTRALQVSGWVARRARQSGHPLYVIPSH